MATDQRASSFGFILVFITSSVLYSGFLSSNGAINLHAFPNLWIRGQGLHTELILFFQEPVLPWQRRRHLETKGYSCSRLRYLNVRSLKSLEHLQLVKHTILQNKLDVLTLSETWLNNSITDLELEIPGYHLYCVDRNTKSGG